jgi:arylsulfatase A-like enzyme
MQAPEADLQRFAHIQDPLRRTYCAMVHRLDLNVGKILEELRAQRLESRTLVVFLSDNGGPNAPQVSNGSVNAPLRGGKTTVLEGGIRVPMIFRWPGNLPAGKTVEAMVSALDILPTFVAAAGGQVRETEQLDGVDLLPFFTGKSAQPPHDSLKWLYTAGSAIRRGDWKLVRLPDRLPLLYNLSDDPAELKNVALQHPERTAAMLQELGRWEVQAPNPVFREPASWRVRHLSFYDAEFQPAQPE